MLIDISELSENTLNGEYKSASLKYHTLSTLFGCDRGLFGIE
jgi:hypothetical protein